MISIGIIIIIISSSSSSSSSITLLLLLLIIIIGLRRLRCGSITIKHTDHLMFEGWMKNNQKHLWAAAGWSRRREGSAA